MRLWCRGLELHPDHGHGNLVLRARVEPVSAEGRGAEGRLDEGSALELAFAAIRTRALCHGADAHAFERAETELAPRVVVAVLGRTAIAHELRLEVKIDPLPGGAEFQARDHGTERAPCAAEQRGELPGDRLAAG